MIQRIATGTSDIAFTARASDVGFANGVWPTSFVWNGKTFTRWHITPLGRSRSDDVAIAAAEYISKDDVRISVFMND